MSEQSPRHPDDIYNAQLIDNIRNLSELTTRIDERVQSMMKKQEDFDKKIDAPNVSIADVSQRIAVIESKNISEVLEKHTEALRSIENKLQSIEGDTNRSGERGKQIMGFCVQLLWVIVAAFILMKLHLQPPP